MVGRKKCEVFISEQKVVMFVGIYGGKLGSPGLSCEEECTGCYVPGDMGEMPPEPKNTGWVPPSTIHRES